MMTRIGGKFAFSALMALLLAAPAAAADGEVSIRKDGYGVPYIQAAREEDAFYGLGYAQASDRLELVLRTYMAAEGRRAELDGPSALPSDFMARHFFSIEEARQGYAALSPQIQRNLSSFVAGVKRWMAENPRKVPAWAPDFGPEHIVLASNARVTENLELLDCARGGVWYGLGLGLEGRIDLGAIGELGRSRRLAQATGGFVGRNQSGLSNSAAIAPSRMAARAAALIGDPHSDGINGEFFEFVLHGGDYSLAGVTDPGNFITTLGNGRNIAWTATSGGTDSSDCFVFQVDPADPLKVRYGNGTRPVLNRKLLFKVKGSAPVEVEQQHVLHNGVLSPVMARADGMLFAISPGNRLDPAAAVRQVYEIARAKDVDDALVRALSQTGAGSETQTFADSSGNIFIIRQGKTPVRQGRLDYRFPIAATPETEWRGLHGPQDFVQVRNPPTGFVHGNNEEPWTWSAEGLLDPTRFPSYISNVVVGFDLSLYRQGSRSLTYSNLLGALDKATTADLMAIAYDSRLQSWPRWQSALTSAFPDAKRSALTPAERAFLDSLLAFDGNLANESEPAARAAVWLETAFGAFLPPDAAVRITRNVLGVSGPAETDAIWLRASIAPAAAEFQRRSRHLSGRLTLGDLYRIRDRTGQNEIPFRAGDFALGWGVDADALEYYESTAPNYWFEDQDARGVKYMTGGGLRTRIVQFTTPMTILSVVMSRRESSDPSSPGYMDQAKLASERRMKQVPFEPAEIQAATQPWKTLHVRK